MKSRRVRMPKRLMGLSIDERPEAVNHVMR